MWTLLGCRLRFRFRFANPSYGIELLLKCEPIEFFQPEAREDLEARIQCARRSESRPVRRSESDPPEGGSFYVVLT